MKTKFVFRALFLALLAAGIGAYVFATANKPKFEVADFGLKNADKNGKIELVDDEIVVKMKGEKGFKVMKVAKGKVAQEVENHRKKNEVEFAEPNYIARALFVPNDPYYQYQWHFNLSGGINAGEAWDISLGDGVVVAIVDTGIAYETYSKFCKATDLASTCFVSGYNFVNNTTHANDDNGHGTHVAGTVAQSTNNGLGTAGVAHKSCLMPVKVLNSAGSGTYAAIANGIIWAADNGANVINMSLGGTSGSEALLSAIKYANSKGATIVAACGNNASGAGCLYPAAYNDYVISVGATQYDRTKAPYSNYGANLDLVAPGGNTAIDQNGDGYADGILQQTFASSRFCSFGYYFYQGTSMAAPHVAGTVALLIANGNAANPDDVKTALKTTARDLGVAGRDDVYGDGLIDAAAALQWPAGPVFACSEDKDCNDDNDCTADVCNNPGTLEAACTHANLAEGAVCGAGICCAGNCSAPACNNNSDCNDNSFCTNDSCDNPGTCGASCSHTPITACANGDGCCPSGCTHGQDTDCVQAALCWSNVNQYLYPNTSQYKKFCKCAQGTYNYKSAVRASGSKTAVKYINTADNEIWTTNSSLVSRPASQVVCGDGKAYPFNVNYYFPK